MSKIKEFRTYRQRMNERILAANNKVIKRIYSIDTLAYEDGSLDKKTKEMLGLVSSLVLRCDDCIKYHLERCFELNVTDDELFEVFAVGNVVGGTIVIPHIRRAVEYWDDLKNNK
ncbi:MAG: carboxymuconolactone decarboxylase family protein [Bacteroidales bacterium]